MLRGCVQNPNFCDYLRQQLEIPPRQLNTLCILLDHFRLICSFFLGICQFGGNMFWHFFSKPSWPVANPQDFQLGVWLLAEDFLLDSEEGRRLCAQVGGKSESILGGKLLNPEVIIASFCFHRWKLKNSPMEKEMFIGTKPPFFWGVQNVKFSGCKSLGRWRY